MPQRRRARYTVTTLGGQQYVILAYSAESARAFYERKGHTVAMVRKGDFRREAQIEAIKSSGPRGRPNLSAIRTAGERLGLTCPVEIKLSGREGGSLGSHLPEPRTRRTGVLASLSPQDAGFRHVITIKSWLPVERMAQVILHELTHAVQFERECLDVAQTAHEAIMRRKAIYFNGVGYQSKRWEREARAAEARTDEFPGLAR